MSIEDKVRIRWSDVEYHKPIRIIIKDWESIQKAYKYYLLIDVLLEYKERPAQLCVPYGLFIGKIRKLPVKQQKLIVKGRAVLELEKLFKSDQRGMRIGMVEKYVGDDKK